jgi:peptidoglycan-N-acetylglucosamine deacetylase
MVTKGQIPAPRPPEGSARTGVIGAVAILMAAIAVTLTAPDPGSTGPPRPAAALAASGFPGADGRGDGKGDKRSNPAQCVARGRTVRRRIHTKQKELALTFDDGPSASTTAFVRTLDRFDAKGTFYVLGQEIPGREAILRRVVQRGHSVGNHTMNHADVSSGNEAARGQIRSTTKRIRAATGVRPCTFRPPGGARSAALDKLVKDEDMVEVLWNVDPEDFSGVSPSTIEARVVSGIGRGNIIVMHDGGGDERNTLAALPRILREVKKRGFKAVTVPELLHLKKKK